MEGVIFTLSILSVLGKAFANSKIGLVLNIKTIANYIFLVDTVGK
jgi:hypothetical protein